MKQRASSGLRDDAARGLSTWFRSAEHRPALGVLYVVFSAIFWAQYANNEHNPVMFAIAAIYTVIAVAFLAVGQWLRHVTRTTQSAGTGPPDIEQLN